MYVGINCNHSSLLTRLYCCCSAWSRSWHCYSTNIEVWKWILMAKTSRVRKGTKEILSSGNIVNWTSWATALKVPLLQSETAELFMAYYGFSHGSLKGRYLTWLVHSLSLQETTQVRSLHDALRTVWAADLKWNSCTYAQTHNSLCLPAKMLFIHSEGAYEALMQKADIWGKFLIWFQNTKFHYSCHTIEQDRQS